MHCRAAHPTSALVCLLAAALLSTADCSHKTSPEWSVPSLPYRIVVEIQPADTGNRASDSMPTSLDIDSTSAQFSQLNLPGPLDLDSIQAIRFDPATGQPLPAPKWPFGRSQGERTSRFIDKSLPWNFPIMASPEPGSTPTLFPGGAFFLNAKGKGNPGLLTWDHTQDGNSSSFYAIYFDTLGKGQRQRVPRQGFIGDGSPRRDIGGAADEASGAPAILSSSANRFEGASLTGSLYNSVEGEDWNADGLPDLLVGNGVGNLLVFMNEGTKTHPKFGAGEYLRDSDGRILNVGSMISPVLVDWNGDGVKDLVCGEEQHAGLVWFQNIGTHTGRKFSYSGHIKTADGKNLTIPGKPCPESPHYQKDYAPAVDAVDWDGDGDVDLLLGGYITGYIWFYENVGKGPDGTPKLVFRGPLQADGKPIDTVWGAHPCAIDLDGDGDLDLLTGCMGQKMGGGDAFEQLLIYYENTGTRTNPKLSRRPVEYDGPEPRDIIAQPRLFSINENGLPDLVVSTFEQVYFAKNVGTRKSPRWKMELLQAPWGLSPLSASQAIDINGDGLLDLIRSPLDENYQPKPMVSINKGMGSHGVFAPPEPLLPRGQEIAHPAPYGDQWNYVYLYDFDLDGALDLLWADGPGYAYLHRNKGTRKNPDYDIKGEKLMTVSGQPIKVGPPVVATEKVPDFTVMQGSRAGITAGDFNGDGKTDIAMGDTHGDVYYFQNQGTNQKPVFASGVKLGNLSSRAVPLTYDWDHDGRLDIVAYAWSGQMVWYRNQGPGAQPRFARAQPLNLPPTVPLSPRLLIADWNGDGDDDFLVMSAYPWFSWLDGSYVKHGYAQAKIIAMERKN